MLLRFKPDFKPSSLAGTQRECLVHTKPGTYSGELFLIELTEADIARHGRLGLWGSASAYEINYEKFPGARDLSDEGASRFRWFRHDQMEIVPEPKDNEDGIAYLHKVETEGLPRLL